MSIVIPPAPSHEAAAEVFAKLAQISNKEPADDEAQTPSSSSQIVLGISCALCAAGILLLICAIVIMCAPDSLAGRLILLVCQTVF